jgi:hypothetical protein
MRGEDSGPPPPEEKKLRQLLGSLPEDMVYKLLVIMHLGRGTLTPATWPGTAKP